MKSKILTFLSLASMFMFGACGDDSSSAPATKAQECAAGLSEACLLGTWMSNGPIETKDYDGIKIVEPSQGHDFTTSPAKLTFSIDEKNQKLFEFSWSPLSTAACKDGVTYGTWSIVANQLTLTTTAGNTCFKTRSVTLLPAISNTGANIEMNFGKLFFLAPEMEEEDNVLRQNDYEIFYINAK